MNYWKIIFATVIIFGAGVLTGGLWFHGGHLHGKRLSPSRHQEPSSVSTNLVLVPIRPMQLLMQQLETSLQLTAEERENIQKILDEGQHQIHKAIQDARLEVREVLPPEKQKEFDEMMKRRPRKSTSPTNAPGISTPMTVTNSQTRAMEQALFKLTSEELFKIGIVQAGDADHLEWLLATETGFADGGKAFEAALARVGVKPSGFLDLGMVGWYVPREQFFVARQALLAANLRTNEIKIVTPEIYP